MEVCACLPACCMLQVAGLRIAAVAAGMQHSLALSEDGRVFAWGAGHYGALGLGPSEYRCTVLKATFAQTAPCS